MRELKPCPMCGSPVKVESTGALECYGKAWQTLYVTCTEKNDENCGMSLHLQADFFYVKDSEAAMVECWNRLCGESNEP